MKTLSLLLIAFLPIASVLKAETPWEPIEKRSEQELLDLAKKRQSVAIRELGRRKIQSAIPILKEVAAEPDIPEDRPLEGKVTNKQRERASRIWEANHSHLEAKIALARMGDDASLNEFIVGLSSTNLVHVANCMSSLARIGDRRAVKYFIPFLTREDHPPVPEDRKDIPVYPFKILARDMLAIILPEVQGTYAKQNQLHGQMSEKDWLQWWELNSASFN